MASVVDPDIAVEPTSSSVGVELISSSVGFEEQADLAGSLRILDTQRKEIEYRRRFKWRSVAGKQLIAQVQLCLDALPGENSQVVQQAIRIRKYVETVMLWEVADKDDLREDLIRRLQETNDQIRGLAGCKECTASDSAACLDLDAQFHKIICIQSGRANLTRIVEEVQHRLREIGGPRNRREILEVWSEHQNLIRALQETGRQRRRDAISSSVIQHLNRAFERLTAKEGEMSKKDCFNLVMRGVEQYFAMAKAKAKHAEIEMAAQGMLDWYWEAARGALTLEDCSELAARLAMGALYPKQYVVYCDDSMELDGIRWTYRNVLFATYIERLAYEFRDEISGSGGQSADKLIVIEFQYGWDHAFAAHS